MNFQNEKRLVRDYLAALDQNSGDALLSVQEQFVAPRYLWRGFHPFNEMTDGATVAQRFWDPLKASLTSMQRRMDVFMAGTNSMGSGAWVSTMGHLMGLFDQPWLNIPATGKIAVLRYADFHLVENGKITETAMFFDIPHLMIQAGLRPFPTQTAAHLVQPGPLTHDGLLFEPQPEAEGRETLRAIEAMIADLRRWDLGLPLEEELRRTWHEDMLWWGPAGIGSTYTIPRYARQHAGPFRAAFGERSPTKHICRIAEGHYGGFFGWPNFMATLEHDFMGLAATGKSGEFRVIDIYRRDGDKLAENWIFIDFLHFWKQQGIDILGGVTEGKLNAS